MSFRSSVPFPLILCQQIGRNTVPSLWFHQPKTWLIYNDVFHFPSYVTGAGISMHYFSSPNVFVDGKPTGDDGVHNSVKVICGESSVAVTLSHNLSSRYWGTVDSSVLLWVMKVWRVTQQLISSEIFQQKSDWKDFKNNILDSYRVQPTNGYWNHWTPWSTCTNGGKRIRTRNCDLPPPRAGGKNCEGHAIRDNHHQEKSC